MGNTKKFEIVITTAGSVFLPGQCIEGHVLVEFLEETKITAIFMFCTSKAEVVWQESKIMCHGQEYYLRLQMNLFERGPNSDDVTLSAGTHMFPFTFQLPANLPGSFEGSMGGYVRHWLKAVMRRPWKSNKQYKMMFTVPSVLDLNSIHDVATPQTADMSTRAGCLSCCNDGRVSATFRLEKKGFVPGESIKIYGEVVDGMNIGINSTDITLERKDLYSTGTVPERKADFTKRTCSIRHGQVRPGGTDVWDGDKLRIPPIPPSYLPGCNIINTEYLLKVVVNISRSFGATLRLTFPIVIGTVPLYSTVKQSLANRQRQLQNDANESDQSHTITCQPQSNIVPSAPSLPAAGAQVACASIDLPSPSYKESVFGKVNTKQGGEHYIAGNWLFAPSYTYYEEMD